MVTKIKHNPMNPESAKDKVKHHRLHQVPYRWRKYYRHFNLSIDHRIPYRCKQSKMDKDKSEMAMTKTRPIKRVMIKRT